MPSFTFRYVVLAIVGVSLLTVTGGCSDEANKGINKGADKPVIEKKTDEKK